MIERTAAEIKKDAIGYLQSNPVFLDTETTGLDANAEICEIAILDTDGSVLLHSLVRPTRPIPPVVEKIHGISNMMVRDAPTWLDVRDRVIDVLFDRTVAIYNRDYDVRLIEQSDKMSGKKIPFSVSGAFCVMELYSEFYGEWNDYRGNYKWQKLTTAARNTAYVSSGGKAHRADEDCRMTRHVLRYLSTQHEIVDEDDDSGIPF